MTILTVVLVAGALSGDDSVRDGELYDEAVAALQKGSRVLAAQKARELVARNGKNPDYFMILGDAYVADGLLPEASKAYERSSELRGHNDAPTLKKLASVLEWTRQYSLARASLQRSLHISSDDEARISLGSIALRRSLHVFGSAGGWEVDYARNVQELGAFVGWVDWMDLYGGVSQTDRILYRRSSVWLDGYLFVNYHTYIRVGLRNKAYEYPASINPNPDNSSYSRASHVQLEGCYVYGNENSVSLEMEYFRPSFFWNTALHANNLKVGLSLRNTIAGPVYAKLFAAVLHDPDPNSFVMDPASHATLSFGYETLSLLGAGLGYDDGRLSAEMKYVPDRDLDRSLSWSVFVRGGYRSGRFGVQGDLLYDSYPDSPVRRLSSRVSMLTVLAEPWDSIELRVGVKALTQRTTELAPFIYVRVKTGI